MAVIAGKWAGNTLDSRTTWRSSHRSAITTQRRMSGPKYKPSEPVDFLVIGAGASGGVMAKELSTTGFNVVVLEQGPYLRERDYSHDEIKYTVQPGLTNDP